MRWIGSLVAAAALMGPGEAWAQETLPPNYGEVRGIGHPDPYLLELTAGGPEYFEPISLPCRAYTTRAPDLRYWHDGSGSLPLILSVRSEADTVLIVNPPDGVWRCDDDGGEGGLNPSIRFVEPLSGSYDIWVGTYGSQTAPATLSISELYTY